MPDSITGWLEAHADRELGQQRATVDSIKLVATFVSAIAATLVATALQVGDASWLDLSAAVALGMNVLLTGVTVRLDRLDVANPLPILQTSAIANWTQDYTLSMLRSEALAAVLRNNRVIERLQALLRFSLWIAGAASSIAVVSLLGSLLGVD